MKTNQPFEPAMTIAFALLITSSFALVANADDKPPKVADASELSIAPLDHVEYPADRPLWIEAPPKESVDESVGIVVISPPQPTPEAATEMMEVMAKGAVENYIDQQATSIAEPIDTQEIVVEMDWIRNELIRRRYDGEVQRGEQTEYESACLIQLDQEHQTVLQNLIKNHQLTRRLAVVGVFALGGFMTLIGGSIVFSGLASRQQRRQAQAA